MAVIAPQTKQSETGQTQAGQSQTGQTETGQAGSGQTGQTLAEPQGLFAFLDAAEIALDATDPACCSLEGAAEVLRRLTRLERKVVAHKTAFSARLAQGSLYTRTGHRSAAEFLAATTGDSVGEAKDLIRLGEALVDQPSLAESFLAGKLSHRRASRVSDTAKVNPAKRPNWSTAPSPTPRPP